MDPIKLRLCYHEAKTLGEYMASAAAIAYQPQAREELIVLAEYLLPLTRQCYTNAKRNRLNYYAYSMPCSVARILHRRFQQEELNHDLQMILAGLDKELTNRGMKPDPAKPTFF